MYIRIFALTLILFSSNTLADSWGPDLIKFDIEGGPKIQTMIWISGYSYSATAFHRRCGAIPKSKDIRSKYLIEKLNAAYAGMLITSEQASFTLDMVLGREFPCK